MPDFFSDSFEGLPDDDNLITPEELKLVSALMDEPDLTDAAYDFINDLAGQGEGAYLTGPMREWLERLRDKHDL